jgi:hypothetical protein
VNQKLELTKCGYHAIEYEFLPTGEPKLINKPPVDLVLMDEQGNCFEIEQWLYNRAAQYLGCKKSISNKKTQLLRYFGRNAMISRG